MGLPGLTTSQMIEVDRIMVEDLDIHLELMMEHAGLNFARLALEFFDPYSRIFRIIAGSGNNGGGGLVAARKLSGWGYETEVVIPRGKNSLREIPKLQLSRAENTGATLIDDLEVQTPEGTRIVLDSYLGYGFKSRNDEISEAVFAYLRAESNVVSLDIPSGLDSTTGESYSQLKPLVTMSLAFVKTGLLHSPTSHVGELLVADIGVPKDVFLSKLNLSWDPPASTKELDLLYTAFAENPIQRVNAWKPYWSMYKR